MGACLSCCGGDRKHAGSSRHQHSAPTERDIDARMKAAEKAEARQTQFAQSAVGRAAYKSVQEVKRQEQRPADKDNLASGWLS